MSKLKKRIHKLKQIGLLLKRITYSVFHKTHPIFRKKDYLLNLFNEKTPKYNIQALNFQEGIVLGEFQDKNYLIHCQPGNLLESTIYIEKIWEGHLIKIMSLYLDGGSGVMIDVGSNVGANTLPLAAKHPQVKLHCFEPHPEIYKRLKSNIKINNINNVVSDNYAISNSPEKSLKFFAQKHADNMGRSSLKLNSDIKDHEEITVPTTRIDDRFADTIVPVLLIKVDTQGTELDILQSAEKTVEKFRPAIIFELEDRYFQDSERVQEKKTLQEFFDSINYRLFNVSKGLNFFPKLDITQNYHGDILALPQ